MSCDVGFSYRSVHSIVILNLDLRHVTHGKGLWKFINSLLYDKDHLKIINEKKIEEIKNNTVDLYIL